MLSKLRQKLGIHPRLWIDSLLTYPRFMGQIKPRLLDASEDETQARLMALQRCWDPSILKAPLGKRLLVVSPIRMTKVSDAGDFCSHTAGVRMFMS